MLVFQEGLKEAKKAKYSKYDLEALLNSLGQKVETTVWREDGFGETIFSSASGNWNFVEKVVDEIFQKINKGDTTRAIVDFAIKRLFPKVKIPQLITAIKQKKLSFQSYGESLICITIESTLPEYIEYFAAQR